MTPGFVLSNISISGKNSYCFKQDVEGRFESDAPQSMNKNKIADFLSGNQHDF